MCVSFPKNTFVWLWYFISHRLIEPLSAQFSSMKPFLELQIVFPRIVRIDETKMKFYLFISRSMLNLQIWWWGCVILAALMNLQLFKSSNIFFLLGKSSTVVMMNKGGESIKSRSQRKNSLSGSLKEVRSEDSGFFVKLWICANSH